MPTPSGSTAQFPPSSPSHFERTAHATCPPDSAPPQNDHEANTIADELVEDDLSRHRGNEPPVDAINSTLMDDAHDENPEQEKMPGAIDEYQSSSDGLSPASISSSDVPPPEVKENEQNPTLCSSPPDVVPSSSYSSTSLDDGVSSIRVSAPLCSQSLS